MSAIDALSEPTLRVAILDEHRLVAESIATLLDRAGHDVALIASTWSELLDSPTMPVDIVVMDLHLEDGVLIATKVRALNNMGSTAIVISRHADPSSISSVMRAGALAFVAKTDSATDLLAAIEAAAAGSLHLADHHARVAELSDAAPGPRLGRQEERALVLYAGGRSIREVATAMRTTEETIKSYIKRARRKYREAGVDVGTRILLRSYAASQGWLATK